MTHPLGHFFNRAVPHYEQLAHIQREVADELAERLVVEAAEVSVLEVGCGSGFLTQHLSRHFDAATSIDLSSGMVEACREKFPRVAFYASDVMDFAPEAPFELVTSSSSLHWVSPFAQVPQKLRGLLLPEGRVAISLMIDGTLDALHRIRAEVAPDKLPSAHLPTSDEVVSCFEEAGFRITYSAVQCFWAKHPNATQFLKELSLAGLTGPPLGQARQLLSPSELKQLIKRYDQECSISKTAGAGQEAGVRSRSSGVCSRSSGVRSRSSGVRSRSSGVRSRYEVLTLEATLQTKELSARILRSG